MIRCDTCNRHIRATEATCPFCAGAGPSRLRGGLIAAGLLLLSGCPTTGVAVYGGPPEPEDAATDAATDAGPTDAEVADGMSAQRREALGTRGAALAQALNREHP